MKPVVSGQTAKSETTVPWIFSPHALSSWSVLGIGCLYVLFCWGLFFHSVDPIASFSTRLFVGADSNQYWEAAGFADPNAPAAESTELPIGTNLLGPVLLAKIFRTQGMVAVFDCTLLLLIVISAGKVPGVRRDLFLLLLLADAATIPTLITLNKEIVAIAGLIFFAQYIYSKKRHLWLLAIAILFSAFARWEQVLILLLYLGLESRFSPFRRRHRTGLFAFVLVISVVYPIAYRFAHVNLAAFLIQAEGAGTIVRLDNLQAKGAFFLVVWPKILMNLAGRLITPSYFLGPFWSEDFRFLQTQVFGNLHNVALIGLFFAAWVKGRMRLSRPLPYIIMLYLVMTAVSPFVQSRYEYPIYALLCLEMSRTEASLEPVRKRWLTRAAETFPSPLAPDPHTRGHLPGTVS